MATAMHFFFHNLFLSTLTVFSLLLILGVIVGDWLDKRRERKLLELCRAETARCKNGLRGSGRISGTKWRARRSGFVLATAGIVVVGSLLVLKGKFELDARARGKERMLKDAPAARNPPVDGAIRAEDIHLVTDAGTASAVTNQPSYWDRHPVETNGVQIIISTPKHPAAEPETPSHSGWRRLNSRQDTFSPAPPN